MDLCRLCLSKDLFLLDVSESRHGLPISVIIMIIMPVKIETNDSLPKQICEECLEVVLSAYKLRDESLKSDRYLRESNVSTERDKKEPDEFLETDIFFESLDSEPFEDENLDSGKYEVDCSRYKSRRYSVWNFMGPLRNARLEIIDKDFVYCRLCVEQSDFRKFPKSTAMTGLLQHLKLEHKINEASLFKKPKTSKRISQSLYCDHCSAVFKSKSSIEAHILRAHIDLDNHNQKTFAASWENTFGHKVSCFENPKSKSYVWEYFGRLVDMNGEDVEESFGLNFCKLCVETRNPLDGKYSVSTSTGTLIRHLKTVHGITSGKTISSDEDQDQEKLEPFTHENINEYKVDCTSVKKAPAWKYFGKLVDDNGEEVDEGAGHFYCKICVEERKSLDYKYSPLTSSTPLVNHLKVHHGIISIVEKSIASVDKTLKPRISQQPRKYASYCQNNLITNCKICSKEFESRRDYWNHLKLDHKHSESPSYICHVCSKSFLKHHYLTKHLQIHAGIEHKCTLCPAVFNYPQGLKKHLKVHDPDHWTKYQCDKCSKAYTVMSTLKDHILKVHLNKPKEKKHKCPYCDMKVYSHDKLQVHIMKHTGEKPFDCQYCDIAYASKGDLTRHLYKVHNRLPYSCTFEGCQESFRFQVDLREHFRVHCEKVEEH